MIARIACLSVLFCLTLAVAGCVPDTMVTSINKLSDDVGQIAEQQKKLSNAVTDVPELKRKVADLETKLNDVVIAHKKEYDDMRALARDTSSRFDDILKQFTRRDSTGHVMLDINTQIDASPEFRRDFAAAVQRVMPTPEPSHGTLIVNNLTGIDRYIWVNGVGHRVSWLRGAALSVPVGDLSTQVSGERVKYWKVAAPTYEVAIDIVPRAIRVYPLESYPAEVFFDR